MAFTLEKVVPWGRSYGEYVDMFDLQESDLRRRIVGCGDGPAGFNAQLTADGGEIVSCDPVYGCTAEQIRGRIDETYDTVMGQLRKNKNDFVWNTIPSPDQLGRIRMSAMESFLEDFESGKRQGRYVAAELPKLPFGDGVFDIALCSHFLFLYSQQLSTEFHLRAIEEMLRVAPDVRVFPLLSLEGTPSRHLEEVISLFSVRGCRIHKKRVQYEFQKGGDTMLSIVRGDHENSTGFAELWSRQQE